jgi:hypothetical protein
MGEGNQRESKHQTKHILFCGYVRFSAGVLKLQEHVISYPLISILAAIQAIDKLEEILDGGMKSGTTNMFGPKEYVAIYT